MLIHGTFLVHEIGRIDGGEDPLILTTYGQSYLRLTDTPKPPIV
jgi:hypothetical protein